MATLTGRAAPRRTAIPFLTAMAAAFRRAGERIVENYRVARTRRILLSLDERTLRDLGLSRAELERL
jgi:uncharacterized protein YjiS (DUF1127 family)